MRRGVSQEAPGLGPSDKKNVDDLFADYLQAFIAKDYLKLRECLQAPFIWVIADEPKVISKLDGVIAFYHTLRDSLDQRGYASTKPKGVARISILTPIWFWRIEHTLATKWMALYWRKWRPSIW